MLSKCNLYDCLKDSMYYVLINLYLISLNWAKTVFSYTMLLHPIIFTVIFINRNRKIIKNIYIFFKSKLIKQNSRETKYCIRYRKWRKDIHYPKVWLDVQNCILTRHHSDVLDLLGRFLAGWVILIVYFIFSSRQYISFNLTTSIT